jgi:TolB-like protein
VAGYTVATTVVVTGAALMAGPVQGTSPRSVVIGKFSNLTNKSEFDYLAAGTAGELARRLSRVPDLRVYRQTDPDASIPASRRPMFTLSGDVQEANAMLRITVQVTDTRQGTVRWSQRFDGPRERALELEDQLATDTVGALVLMQTAEEDSAFNRAATFVARMFAVSRSQIPPSGTTNSTAFDAYLRGRVLFEERTLPAALQAIGYLKRAVQLDPRFAAAFSMLADVHGVLMDLHPAPHDTLIAQVEQYADQAVALDPDLPEAQLSLAALRQMQWRWTDSESAYRRAIELHPTFARAYRWYGGLLLQFGRFEESLALYRRALDLDLYDYPSQSAYGHALFHAGRASEAAVHLEGVLSQKDLFYAHALVGQVYAYLIANTTQRDDYLNRALQESDILRQKETAALGSSAVTEYADMVAALAWSYYGNQASAAPHIERLEAGRAAGRVSPSVLARVYAALRDSPRALDALLQAEAQRDRELFYIAVSPYYASLRDEPQFRALVGRLRLSQ